MSYANIMVHIDRAPDAIKRMILARDLATRFNGRLIGVAAAALPPVQDLDALDERLLGRAEDKTLILI